jgi:hypothetical protein
MRAKVFPILLLLVSLCVTPLLATPVTVEVVKLPAGPICPLFSVSYSESVPSGSEAKVLVSIRNIGSAGTCNVEFVSPTGQILNARSFQMNHGDERKAEYSFTMPSGPVKLLVRSYPFGNGYDYAYVVIPTRSYQPQGVILSSSVPAEIRAKEVPRLSADIINVGSTGNIYVNWSVDSNVVCRSSFSMNNMERKTSYCDVTPPKDKSSFNVSAVVYSSAGITDSESWAVRVVNAYPMPDIVGYEISEFELGRQGEIKVSVVNRGNSSGSVRLDVLTEVGWGNKIILASGRANLTDSVLFDVYLPARPLSSWYSYIPLELRVCSLPSVCDSVSLKANITSKPSVLVTYFNATEFGPPGSTGRIVMTVANTGSASADLRVSVANSTDILWDQTFSVPPNGRRNIYYTFVFPTYKEELYVTLARGTEEIFSKKITVTPYLPPDAFVVELANLTSRAVPNSTVTLALTLRNKLSSPVTLTFHLYNGSREVHTRTFTMGPHNSYPIYYSFTMPPSTQQLSMALEDYAGNVLFFKSLTVQPVSFGEATPSACPWIYLYEWWPGQWGQVTAPNQTTTATTTEPAVVTISVLDSPPASARPGDLLKSSLKAHNGKDVTVRLEMAVQKSTNGVNWTTIDNATYTVAPHSDQIMEALWNMEVVTQTYRVLVKDKDTRQVLFQQDYTVTVSSALFGPARQILPLPEIYTLTTQAAPLGGYVAGTFWVVNKEKLDAMVGVYIPMYTSGSTLGDFAAITAYNIPPSSRYPFTYVLKPPSSQTYKIRVAQDCPVDYTKRTVVLYKVDVSSVYEMFNLLGIPPSAIPSYFLGNVQTVLSPSGKLYYPFSPMGYTTGKGGEIPGESIPLVIDPNLELEHCSLSASAPSSLKPGQRGTVTFYSNCTIMAGRADTSINVAPGVDLLHESYHASPYSVNFTMPSHDVVFLAWAVPSGGGCCQPSNRITVTVKVDKSGPVFWIDSLTYDQFAKPHKLMNVTMVLKNVGSAAGNAIVTVGNSSKTVHLDAGGSTTVYMPVEVPEHSFSLPVSVSDGQLVHESYSFNVYTTGFIKPVVELKYPSSAINQAYVQLHIKNAGTLTPGAIWYRVKTPSGAILASGSLLTVKNDEYFVGMLLKVPPTGLNATLEVGHQDPEENKLDYTQSFYVAPATAAVSAGILNLTYPKTALPTERINVSFVAFTTAPNAFWELRDSRNGSLYASGTLGINYTQVAVPLQMPYHSLDLNVSLVHPSGRNNVTDASATIYVILENGTGLAPASFLRGSRFFMPFAGMPSVGFALPWKVLLLMVLIALFMVLLFMRKFWLALAVLVAILFLALPLLWALVGTALIAVAYFVARYLTQK